ncbi:MAG TPA: hypothetical protein VFH16_21910 [Rubrobacter sp.]|nr:hypothetical protein [Rubrobacter sp.]
MRPGDAGYDEARVLEIGCGHGSRRRSSAITSREAISLTKPS